MRLAESDHAAGVSDTVRGKETVLVAESVIAEKLSEAVRVNGIAARERASVNDDVLSFALRGIDTMRVSASEKNKNASIAVTMFATFHLIGVRSAIILSFCVPEDPVLYALIDVEVSAVVLV